MSDEHDKVGVEDTSDVSLRDLVEKFSELMLSVEGFAVHCVEHFPDQRAWVLADLRAMVDNVDAVTGPKH